MSKIAGVMHYIENGKLRAAVSTWGAVLESLYDISKSRELLWQLDKTGEFKQFPLTFPIVNMIANNEYTYKGKRYHMEIHGFAHKSEFTVSEKTATSIALTLVSNDATRQEYPFDFELTIRYTLDGGALQKEYIVTNKSGDDMFYNAGGHEGYRLAVLDGEKMDDYYLVFGETVDLTAYRYSAISSIRSGETYEFIPEPGRRLYLSMENLYRDSLSFNNMSGKFVELYGPNTGFHARVRFGDFNALGLWTQAGPPDTNYICIEPHMVLPDSELDSTELTEKTRYRRLAPGQTEALSYFIDTTA